MCRPSLLRDPAFLRLWSGTTASGLATWALPFVLGFAVVDRTLTSSELGAVLAARTAGFVVAVPFGGVLADRHSRRRVISAAAATAAIASPLIAVWLARSSVLMAAAAAVVGGGQGACRPAFQALTAEIVDTPRRQQANAAINGAMYVTILVAPGLTALATVVLDTPGLLVGTGLLWVVAGLAPPRGDPAPISERPGGSFVAELAEGVREAGRHPWFLAGMAALTAVIATGYSATGVALPLVSRDHYGGEALFAWATTALTAGALVGAVVVARWQPRAQGWAALAGLGCYGFAPVSLLLTVPPVGVIVAYLAAGIGLELFNTPWFTAAQREVEPRLLARVSSLDFLLSYGLSPVGLALIGPAIDRFGVQPVLGTCAIVCFVAPAVAASVPTSRHFARSKPPARIKGRN